MASWQYQLYILPSEEVNSYFPNSNHIAQDSFDKIDWWKYRDIKIDDFNLFFAKMLPKTRSWSDEITQYGEIDSDCIEIFVENQIVKEISIRIDVRNHNEALLEQIIFFARKFNASLLDVNLNILSLSKEALSIGIENFKSEVSRKFDVL